MNDGNEPTRIVQPVLRKIEPLESMELEKKQYKCIVKERQELLEQMHILEEKDAQLAADMVACEKRLIEAFNFWRKS